MKKSLVAASIGVLLATGLYATPANAATIKNGVNCSKVGATTKVGSKTYRCAKNPYVKPTRLTWTLSSCLKLYATWKDAKGWMDIAKLAGSEADSAIVELQASITSLEDSMQNMACKRGA